MNLYPPPQTGKPAPPPSPLGFLMLYLAWLRKSDLSKVSCKVAKPLLNAPQHDTLFASRFLFNNAISLTLTEKVIILEFHWAIKKKKVHWNSSRWNTVVSGPAGNLSAFWVEKHTFIFKEEDLGTSLDGKWECSTRSFGKANPSPNGALIQLFHIFASTLALVVTGSKL